MTPEAFIKKWHGGGDERRDAQPFFEDLCRVVGHGTPRELDPEHTWFTYEYGAAKTSGGDGWADVWKKGFFGWEAKGTHKSLEKAYEQLKMYADALQNPPLLVVSDLQTIVVHTNFTNTVKREYRLTIDQLADYESRKLLEAVFKSPETLRPGVTRAAVTQEAADKFTRLATALRGRGHEAHSVAHFLNRIVFCMFAEDIGLLAGQLFTKVVEKSQGNPDLFEKRTRELFAAMHKGGDVAFENIEWFNGGLFENDATLRLEGPDLKLLLEACKLDWSAIEPSVFGTLFERGLDPSKRSQLGAHYTDPETIMKIVRPVVSEPLLAEWKAEKAELEKLIGKAKKTVSKAAQSRFNAFLERLRSFTVLDPACGSGNFLYLALRALKDLEKHILFEAEVLGLGRQFPDIGPRNVQGIELNSYAAELARVTIWIGEIQWMITNGYGAKKNPILQPLDQISCRDAILDGEAETKWPPVDAIIGNPPFIGNKKMNGELGKEYTRMARVAYEGRVSGGADFVCFWFEKALAAIRNGEAKRAGLVSTNSIRNGASLKVLKSVVEHTRLFDAWSDEEWWDKGAAVRVSLICFGNSQAPAMLDGVPVKAIAPNLKPLLDQDITKARVLASNLGVAFQGLIPRSEINKKEKIRLGLPDASFVLDGPDARRLLSQPATPKGEPIRAVVKPYCIADDITGRPEERFIINFGDRTEAEAALFEGPFAAIANVRLHREQMEDGKDKRNWWQLARSRPALYRKLNGLKRYIATPRVAKHRIFVWLDAAVVPDCRLFAIAKDDDTFFGILHSRIHEVWSLETSSRHGVGNDPTYNAESCFETFPFPDSYTPDLSCPKPEESSTSKKIAEAAQQLIEYRDRWLNPPEWVERSHEVVSEYPDRLTARKGRESDLKKRTLTDLYNEQPTWLKNLHRALDEAVAAAYGWEWPLTDEEILKRLFALNQARSKADNS